MSETRLANRLRALRAHQRWTQQALAERVDVTRQTIIAIEKGEYNPSLLLALKIAAAFQLAIEDLFWLEVEE